MRTLFDLGCPMRDGTRLSADVYLPEATEPAPAVLVRTPYDNTRADFTSWARRFTASGYVLVLQDVRGRGDSDGVFTPWSDDFDDGYDSVEWVAAQPWCNGRVGMLGGSYMAWVQWAAAARHPPHLVTMVTSGSPGRWFRDWPFRFGAFWAEDYLEWLNRVAGRSYQPPNLVDWMAVHQQRRPRTMDTVIGRPMPHWQECLDHDTLDDYWESLAITGYEAMNLPVLHITGYFDACAPGEFHHFHEMVRSSPVAGSQTLLVGAWDHSAACGTGQAVVGALEVGSEATLDLPAVWLSWFDRWLRGQRGIEWPTVRYFAMGANVWRESDAWPPSDTAERSFYLDGEEISAVAPTTGTSRSYRYDPSDPTPALNPISGDPLPQWAPWDLAFLTAREDVLVYTSEPLTEALEFAGPVRCELWAASSAVDTDFAVVLSDVTPDGRSVFLCHGILRASFRASLSHPSLLVPGERYLLPIELDNLGHVFLPGHRIRIIIASSLFPCYHPNPNTGALYGDEEEGDYVIASQTIFAGADHSSRLVVHVR